MTRLLTRHHGSQIGRAATIDHLLLAVLDDGNATRARITRLDVAVEIVEGQQSKLDGCLTLVRRTLPSSGSLNGTSSPRLTEAIGERMGAAPERRTPS